MMQRWWVEMGRGTECRGAEQEVQRWCRGGTEVVQRWSGGDVEEVVRCRDAEGVCAEVLSVF